MRVMTATEASRSFAALLDQVERGDTVVVTRGGRRIATIAPATSGNGAAVIEMLRSAALDNEFATDVLAARDAAEVQGSAWAAD